MDATENATDAFRKTQPTFEEAYGAPDAHDLSKLHPDLQPYVTTSALGMKVLKHPFVVDLIPAWRMANWLYEWKCLERDAAMAARDWSGLMYRVLARPFRLPMLRQMFRDKTITLAELRELLPGVWSDAEPDDTDRRWRALWKRAAKGGFVDNVDDPMPEGEFLTVYRGQHAEHDKLGIAWSLDPAIAEFFARRFNHGPTGVVLKATAHRGDILGWVPNRGESEVIIDPVHLTPTVSAVIATQPQSKVANDLRHMLNDWDGTAKVCAV